MKYQVFFFCKKKQCQNIQDCLLLQLVIGALRVKSLGNTIVPVRRKYVRISELYFLIRDDGYFRKDTDQFALYGCSCWPKVKVIELEICTTVR